MDPVAVRLVAAAVAFAVSALGAAGGLAALGWRYEPPIEATPSRTILVIPPTPATPAPAPPPRPLVQADRHSWRMQ